MSLTRPGRMMFTSIGDAAEKSVGTASDQLPTNNDIPQPAFATQAEAEAGAISVRHMSPLRTADAISALGLGLRRGGSLDLSSGTGGIITNLGGVADPDVIEILFAGVSVSGSDHLLVRLGDSAGVETESYQSASGASSASGTFASSSTGLVIYQGGSGHWNGCMQLRRVTGNLWISSHAIQISATGGIAAGGGQKAVTATLDRIAIAVSGANTFDGGSVQVLAGKAG